MNEKTQYWPPTHAYDASGAQMELRASLAWNLIHHFGIVTAKPGEAEDSSGRNVLVNMSPEDTVARAFALADAFVDTAEARGEIRSQTEAGVEQAFARGGDLDRIRTDAQYPQDAERRLRQAKDLVEREAQKALSAPA